MKTLQYTLDNEGEYGIRKGVPGLHDAIKDELRIFQTVAILEVITAAFIEPHPSFYL